jgi:hypothetical protein
MKINLKNIILKKNIFHHITENTLILVRLLIK